MTDYRCSKAPQDSISCASNSQDGSVEVHVSTTEADSFIYLSQEDAEKFAIEILRASNIESSRY